MEDEIKAPVKVEHTEMSLTNPEDISKFAGTLKKFIEENKLSTVIKGNKYVLCDGWKFAGLNFGLTAIPQRPQNESKPDELKYSCEVELIQIATGKKLGYGFAICSNKESSKKAFDEYSIASMAQTRAIAKAFRNLIGFIMMAAGYADTPAEEVTEAHIQDNIKAKTDTEITDEIALEIQRIGDIQGLQKYWDASDLKTNKSFNQLIMARKKALTKKQ